MTDKETTLMQLKSAVIDMCRRKGWGVDGIQNPQHVTMAMMVETMELLEHFTDLSAEAEMQLRTGGMQQECIDIAEELSDVLMYSLQLMYTLKVDISKGIHDGFTDSETVISELRRYAGTVQRGLAEQAMRIGIKARFVLEVFQWLDDRQVQLMISGDAPETCMEAGKAFASMFYEILILSNMLGIDIAASIARKIAIVDKRVYPEDDPVR